MVTSLKMNLFSNKFGFFTGSFTSIWSEAFSYTSNGHPLVEESSLALIQRLGHLTKLDIYVSLGT